MADLKAKQLLFAEAYLGPARFNATEAARLAKYAGNDVTLASVGYENLRKPQIAEYVKQRLSETAMSADEVLARLADIARGSMADFLNEAGRIDLELARRNGKLHLIKSRSITKEGERIETYSAQEALNTLAKIHGLLIDRQEQGKPGDFAPKPRWRDVTVELPSEPHDDQHLEA